MALTKRQLVRAYAPHRITDNDLFELMVILSDWDEWAIFGSEKFNVIYRIMNVAMLRHANIPGGFQKLFDSINGPNNFTRIKDHSPTGASGGQNL